MESSIDQLSAALDAVQANVAAEMGALMPGILRVAEDAARQDFERRAALLLASIQAQLEAAKAARMLGVASSDIAGLVVVPVVVGEVSHGREIEDGTFRRVAGQVGQVAFAIQLGASRHSAFGYNLPFEDVLRRGLPPGKYRFVGAMVREEAGAGEGSAS